MSGRALRHPPERTLPRVLAAAPTDRQHRTARRARGGAARPAPEGPRTGPATSRTPAPRRRTETGRPRGPRLPAARGRRGRRSRPHPRIRWRLPPGRPCARRLRRRTQHPASPRRRPAAHGTHDLHLRHAQRHPRCHPVEAALRTPPASQRPALHHRPARLVRPRRPHPAASRPGTGRYGRRRDRPRPDHRDARTQPADMSPRWWARGSPVQAMVLKAAAGESDATVLREGCKRGAEEWRAGVAGAWPARRERAVDRCGHGRADRRRGSDRCARRRAVGGAGSGAHRASRRAAGAVGRRGAGVRVAALGQSGRGHRLRAGL